jgi:hypothetical protein
MGGVQAGQLLFTEPPIRKVECCAHSRFFKRALLMYGRFFALRVVTIHGTAHSQSRVLCTLSLFQASFAHVWTVFCFAGRYYSRNRPFAKSSATHTLAFSSELCSCMVGSCFTGLIVVRVYAIVQAQAQTHTTIDRE